MAVLDTASVQSSDEILEDQQQGSSWLFYAIQMLLSFGQNLNFQFLPVFARKIGTSNFEMGFLTATQNVSSTFFQPLWGRLSDKMGRRIFLLLGSFLSATACIILAFAETPIQVIIIVAISGIGYSIFWPAWSGAQADRTRDGNRGEFIGRLFSVGAYYVAIAMALLAVFFHFLDNVPELTQYRGIFVASGINFALIVVLAWFLIDKKGSKEGHSTEGTEDDHVQVATTHELSPWLQPLVDPTFRRFLVLILFWWFWMSLAWSYFAIFISDIVQATTLEIAVLAFTSTIVQAIVSRKFGKVIDKIGVKRALPLGFTPWVFIPLCFALSTEWWHLIGAQLIAGLGIGAGFASVQTYILDIAGEEKAGYYMGTYQIAWGLLTFSGALFGGWLLTQAEQAAGSLETGIVWCLLFVFGARAVSAFLLHLLLPDPNNKPIDPKAE